MRWITQQKLKSHLKNNQQEYKMKGKGYVQGNMSPDVKDYQPKMSSYADNQPNKTTEYVSRRDKIQDKMASGIKKQEYKGRYD